MQPGELVMTDPSLYPRLVGKYGVIVEKHKHFDDKWLVMIGGRIHPYAIHEKDMRVINPVNLN